MNTEFRRSTKDRDYTLYVIVSAIVAIGAWYFDAIWVTSISIIVGVALLIAVIRKTEAFLRLSSEKISWDFAGFRLGSGEIDACDVQSIVVNDCGSRLEITLRDSSVRTVPYSANGRDVYTAARKIYPEIPTEYKEGT